MQDLHLIGAIKIIAWISNAEGLPHPLESVVRIRLHWPSCSMPRLALCIAFESDAAIPVF